MFAFGAEAVWENVWKEEWGFVEYYDGFLSKGCRVWNCIEVTINGEDERRYGDEKEGEGEKPLFDLGPCHQFKIEYNKK